MVLAWLTMHHVWAGDVELPLDEMNLKRPSHNWFSACLLMDLISGLMLGGGCNVEDETADPHKYALLLETIRPVVLPRRRHLELLPLTSEQKRAYDEIMDRYRALHNDPDACNAVRVRGETGTGKSRVLDTKAVATTDYVVS